MAKLDPYKNKERYLAWKEKNHSGIPDISKENSDLTIRFLNDMESGLNICASSKKGSRSYIRLNVLRQRLIALSKAFDKRFNLTKITDITEIQLFSFFVDMRNGIINGWFDNNQIGGYCLKADIRHYFEEVNHYVLISIIQRRIADEKVIWLIKRILANLPDGKLGGGGERCRHAPWQSNFSIFCKRLSK